MLKIVLSMASWYACSMVTLFLNKSLLTSLDVPVHYLAMGQMFTTCALGAAKVYCTCAGAKGASGSSARETMSRRAFYRNIFIVGLLRGSTVVLGLVSLQHVAASFTEAIKSSAPLFTVLFAWLILRVKTGWRTIISLVPVMVGLLLTSGTELSFEIVGFSAAMATNCVDCVQNVFSKKLMRALTPVQLQFYTSAAAITIQLPVMLVVQREMISDTLAGNSAPLELRTVLLLCVACVFYHLQSVAAYYCVDSVAPVTMSVANTLKRGILIALSIVYFGNDVFATTYFGMATILAGIGLYTYVRSTETDAAAGAAAGAGSTKYEVVGAGAAALEEGDGLDGFVSDSDSDSDSGSVGIKMGRMGDRRVRG
jgi:solute carrier family 35 protein E2